MIELNEFDNWKSSIQQQQQYDKNFMHMWKTLSSPKINVISWIGFRFDLDRKSSSSDLQRPTYKKKLISSFKITQFDWAEEPQINITTITKIIFFILFWSK